MAVTYGYMRRVVKFRGLLPILILVGFVLVACNRDGDETPTTVAPETGTANTSTTLSGSGDVTTTMVDSGTAAVDQAADQSSDSETTTVATTAAAAMPNYDVVHRLIDDGRETLVVVVEPGVYSNVQLENLVYDIVEQYTPSAAIVVDDATVAELAVLEERTEAQQADLDMHTLLRIQNGVEVTFHGPYADFPGLTVGS